VSSTLRQLLADLTVAAARVTLASSRFTGQNIDPAQFAHANRPAMLQVIARLPRLRDELADTYRDELADAHPLLRELIGSDLAAAAAAAATLADPAQVKKLAREARDQAGEQAGGARAGEQDAERSAAEADERRRQQRVEQRLTKLRDDRDRARAQRDQALSEAKAARLELAEALDDRDEALAVVDALRAELNTERRAGAAHATDVTAAARLLAATAAEAAGDTRFPPYGEPNPAAAGLMTAALEATGLDVETLLRVLRALAAPPPPAPAPAPVRTKSREIALTPLGGGTDIGGSCMLVSAGDARILIDAGMRPKRRIDRAGPPDIGIARSGHLDAIVVTHAHNDHAGYVPALTADYANLPVICSPDTAALLPAMWNDSVKVFNQTRSEYVEEGEPPAEPPYGRPEVAAAQGRIRPLDYRTPHEVAGVTIELFEAGHILGAAGVVVTAGTSRVVVTGDVSDLAQASVPGLVVVDAARGADLLVIESTYCGPELTNRDAEVGKFIRTVDEHVSAGGRVLVPAFALGRAQEVALTLRDRLPGVPVLVDGMARLISHIYEERTADSERPLRIFGDQIREVGAAWGMREQEIRTFRRGVIVTTSGMLTSGPAVQWARSVLPDPEAALLVAGYQDEESPGYELLNLAEQRNGAAFRLGGDDVPVRATVRKFGLSAHADRKGLSGIIREVDPGAVMLVHGIAHRQRDFAENLARRGYAVAPTRHWQNG
jgi:Cft2 family RNA processing exonuclease